VGTDSGVCHVDGDLPKISTIEARPVELWLRELPLAPKSKGHVRAALHVLIEFAMWAGILSVGRNPMELVTVKGITKRVKPKRVLSVDEFLRVLSEVKMHFQLIILLCLCFGLRISEVLGLKWSDVNWLKGTLKIERAICEQKVDTVKSSESQKELVMAPELVERLAAWKTVTEFSAQDDWIFASPMQLGRLPYLYTGVWRELQRATKALGIAPIGTHIFRHSYRSWLD
jgi:integrase